METDFVVIGIDPAPAKKTVVFADSYENGAGPSFVDGGWQNHEVKSRLETWCSRAKENGRRVFITWDAPLTGPGLDGSELAEPAEGSHFTIRPIEQLFRARKKDGHQPLPKGISVLGYGACPHWTISRHVLGLPRVGSYDVPENELPYQLLTAQAAKMAVDFSEVRNEADARPRIAEVHPALAMWLLLRGRKGFHERETWEYKKDKRTLHDFADEIRDITGQKLPQLKQSDDHLDAFVAWLLGKAWLAPSARLLPMPVKLFGDRKTGSLLLPMSDEMCRDFVL